MLLSEQIQIKKKKTPYHFLSFWNIRWPYQTKQTSNHRPPRTGSVLFTQIPVLHQVIGCEWVIDSWGDSGQNGFPPDWPDSLESPAQWEWGRTVIGWDWSHGVRTNCWKRAFPAFDLTNDRRELKCTRKKQEVVTEVKDLNIFKHLLSITVIHTFQINLQLKVCCETLWVSTFTRLYGWD